MDSEEWGKRETGGGANQASSAATARPCAGPGGTVWGRLPAADQSCMSAQQTLPKNDGTKRMCVRERREKGLVSSRVTRPGRACQGCGLRFQPAPRGKRNRWGTPPPTLGQYYKYAASEKNATVKKCSVWSATLVANRHVMASSRPDVTTTPSSSTE